MSLSALIHSNIRAYAKDNPTKPEMEFNLPRIKMLIEPVVFRHVLDFTKGNQSRASKILGINRNSFRMRAEKYGLDIYAQKLRDDAKW